MTLSASELARLRGAASAYFPDTCTIQTSTQTSDGQGGWTETWANTYTNVSCRLAPIRSDVAEALQGNKVTAVTRWVLTVAHNQAIGEGDRVVHDSETYEVAHVEDTHSNRTARRAYLRRCD